MTVYKASVTKILLVSTILFIVVVVVFSTARGYFDWYGFNWGILFGIVFAAIPMFFGLGQKVIIDDNNLYLSTNILEAIGSLHNLKQVKIHEIVVIRKGRPQINTQMHTFNAMNISTKSTELSFNIDLYDKKTVEKLIADIYQLGHLQ